MRAFSRSLSNLSKHIKTPLKTGRSNLSCSLATSSGSPITHPDEHSTLEADVLRRSEQYILPVYARPPIVFVRGSGSHLYDVRGRRYLDFSAGIAVNALGHADGEFAKFMYEQATTLIHTSNVYHNEWSGKLAELLVTLTKKDGGLGWASGSDQASEDKSKGAKVFFTNSGTEATEGALKIIRKVGKDRSASKSKYRIVCFANAFHGRSVGALSVTPKEPYQKPFEPLLPGIDVGRLNDDGEGVLEKLITEETCGVIVEPIQGEGGVHAAKPDWLIKVRKRCDEVGAVLIFDEIQCGLFRTGSLWAHSALPTSAHPDIITMAKPLANGYPIGAVLMRDEIAKTMTAGTHGTTFGGSALACALGHHVLTRVSSRAFISQVKENSRYMIERLKEMAGKYPETVDSEIRGRGMMVGLGFKKAENAGEAVRMARERGVLILTAGKDAVRLVPSLNVGKEEIDETVHVLDSVISLA